LLVCVVQVPPELKEDLMLIADKIEPYLQQVKEQADKIPEKAHELAGKIQPAAEKLGDQIEQGASKVLSHAHAHAQLRWSFKLLSIALLTGSGQNLVT
jgi:gas vesicle protein